jgi:hypothetical protein
MGFGVFIGEGDEKLEYVGRVHKGPSTMDEVIFEKEFQVLKEETYSDGKIFRFYFDNPIKIELNQRYTVST